MTNANTDAEQLQYFETMLQNLDSLIIYGGSKRTKVRKLARRTIQALDQHHVTSAGYLSLVLIHYGVGTLLFRGAPEAAITFLRQLVGWLTQEIDRLTQVIEEPQASETTTTTELH